MLSVDKGTEDDFLSLVYKQMYTKTKYDCSSFGQSGVQDIIMVQQIKNFSCKVSWIDSKCKDFHCFIPPFKEKYFSDNDLSFLRDMYTVLYPTATIVEVSRFYKESKKCIINNEEYISSGSYSNKSKAIAAKWPNIVGIDTQGEAPLRIGTVPAFIQHEILLSNSSSPIKHSLAYIKWYGHHPRSGYIHPSMVICSTVFDSESCASFIPVSRIMCRCAVSSPLSLTFDYGVDQVIIAIPLIKCAEHIQL